MPGGGLGNNRSLVGAYLRKFFDPVLQKFLEIDVHVLEKSMHKVTGFQCQESLQDKFYLI